jgi:hypothetical protein
MAVMSTESLPRIAVSTMGYSQLAYWTSLACAVLAVAYIPAGSVRTFVIVTPALTAALCVAASFWVYEACDEFLRARILRAITRTAILVAAGTLVWFFLELAGYPKLSMLWVNFAGWSIFNFQILMVVFASR